MRHRRRPDPAVGGPAAATPSAGSVVALGASAACGTVLLVLAAALSVVQPDPGLLARNLGPQQDQSAKTALFLFTFAVVLPGCAVLAPRIAGRLARRHGRRGVDVVSALLVTTLAGLIVAVRASTALPWGDGLRTLFVAMVLWFLLAAVLLLAARRRPTALDRAGARLPALRAAGVVALGAVLSTVSEPWGRAVLALLAGAAVGCALQVVGRRVPGLAPGRAARLGGLLFTACVLGLAAAVVDVVVFTSDGTPVNAFFPPGVVQFHQDFLLAPAGAVLGGDALLVDAPASQYGIGSIYAVAGWSALTGLGYGTLGLLDGVLAAASVVAAAVVLRAGGVGRRVAVLALGLAVLGITYRFTYSVGSIPQQGPLRFGPPLAVLALATLARTGRHGRALDVGVLVALGVASIWALEAFVYALIVHTSVIAARAGLRPAAGRAHWLARRAAAALAACLVAHLVLATATLVLTGSLPDWGRYLAYVGQFLGSDGVGSIVYGFEPWPPAVALGAGYLTSALGVVVLIGRRSRGGAGAAPVTEATIVALAGSTAWGVALLSYASNRSSDYLLPYISLPGIVVGALWLAVASQRGLARSPLAPRVAAGFAGALALLLLVGAWPTIPDRLERSALGHLPPRGGLAPALRRLAAPPPIDPRSPAVERRLTAQLPGRPRPFVVMPGAEDLSVEALVRVGRTNAVPIGNPEAAGYAPAVTLPPVLRATVGLRPGTRLLTNDAGLAVLRALERDPDAAPPVSGFGERVSVRVLREVQRRFVLRVVGRADDAFPVVELAERRRAPLSR